MPRPLPPGVATLPDGKIIVVGGVLKSGVGGWGAINKVRLRSRCAAGCPGPSMDAPAAARRANFGRRPPCPGPGFTLLVQRNLDNPTYEVIEPYTP